MEVSSAALNLLTAVARAELKGGRLTGQMGTRIRSYYITSNHQPSPSCLTQDGCPRVWSASRTADAAISEGRYLRKGSPLTMESSHRYWIGGRVQCHSQPPPRAPIMAPPTHLRQQFTLSVRASCLYQPRQEGGTSGADQLPFQLLQHHLLHLNHLTHTDTHCACLTDLTKWFINRCPHSRTM